MIIYLTFVHPKGVFGPWGQQCITSVFSTWNLICLSLFSFFFFPDCIWRQQHFLLRLVVSRWDEGGWDGRTTTAHSAQKHTMWREKWIKRWTRTANLTRGVRTTNIRLSTDTTTRSSSSSSSRGSALFHGSAGERMDRAGDGAGQPRYERVCVRLSAHRAGGEFMKHSRGETCFFFAREEQGKVLR